MQVLWADGWDGKSTDVGRMLSHLLSPFWKVHLVPSLVEQLVQLLIGGLGSWHA